MGYILYISCVLIGFICGVLFGRRNVKKVEQAIVAIDSKISDIKKG